MKNLTVVYFSFGPDGPCLLESVKSIRRVYGPLTRICIYDEALNPVDQEIIQEIQPYLYEKTTFNRGGNLNGKECILKMLDCMARAAIATDAQTIMKIDCDTVVLRDWMNHNRRWAMQGVWFKPRAFISGLCYAMDATTPAALIEKTKNRDLWEGKCPEDATISMLSTIFFPGGVCIFDSAQDAPDRIAVGYYYASQQEWATYNKFKIVSFGNRSTMDPKLTTDQKRHVVGQTMQQFTRYIETAQHPDNTVPPPLPALPG